MKKLVILFLVFQIAGSTDAATIPTEFPKASQVMIPIGKDLQISLEQFVTLTPAAYKTITGEKMGFMKKLRLKFNQRQAKKLIRNDGTVDLVKVKKFGFFDRWQWHWGGFAMGFLVIIGPIIALFFKDEYRWDRFWTAMTVSGALISIATVLISSGSY